MIHLRVTCMNVHRYVFKGTPSNGNNRNAILASNTTSFAHERGHSKICPLYGKYLKNQVGINKLFLKKHVFFLNTQFSFAYSCSHKPIQYKRLLQQFLHMIIHTSMYLIVHFCTIYNNKTHFVNMPKLRIYP